MFKRQQIEALETSQAALLSELHKFKKENEQLKAMLSEERCVGEHCRACDNYYGDIHGGVCVKNIKCKNFIETKKAELKLPEEPIKIADMLISDTDTYTNLFGDKVTYNVYGKSSLRQIAEHLLAYCNVDEN